MARQILRGLKGAWPGNALETGWERDRTGYKDPQPRLTPLGAFLRLAAWLPTRQPGQGKERFESPEQCWTFPVRGDDGVGLPRFAPLLDRQFRELLDDDATALRRLRALGLGVWGSDDDAPRLVRYLGELFSTGGVAEVHAGQFQGAYRAAWAAWAACARLGDDTVPFPPDARCYVSVLSPCWLRARGLSPLQLAGQNPRWGTGGSKVNWQAWGTGWGRGDPAAPGCRRARSGAAAGISDVAAVPGHAGA
jgi:hypothetical protein